jgi:hypothetical protein
MSTNDPTVGAAGGAPGAPGTQGQPSEEELRAAYEAELSRITSAELMLQAAVSLLNVGSFRLAPRAPGAGADAPAASSAPQPPSAGDLEQARDAIDAVRALLEIIDRRMPDETAPLRNALSQLQMIYAREAQAAGEAVGAAGDSGAGGGGTGGGSSAPGDSSGGAQPPGGAPGEEQPPGPGPAESSGRLWVPGR